MKAGLGTDVEIGLETEGQGECKAFAAPAPEAIRGHFPQLEILGLLGQGGMAAVYKARQPHLNRLVALKILAGGREQDPAFAERFTREAQTLAHLSHPNIVTLYDFGKVDGLYYLLMEYVDGVSLRQLLQTKKLTPEQALAIVPKICEALQYAHEHGVVHRDIKPENVLLDQEGRVKIADFGIAKMVGGNAGQPAITKEEQVIGTPHYMAPEQVEHPKRVDHRADIYSLGVVFYEMLTGELPLGKFAPPSRLVQVDVRLDEVVLHALEKKPERRYQQASQVKTDVETIRNTDATAPQAEMARHCRIPGTSLALVESRHGLNFVNWTHVSLAWILLLLVGASLLALVAFVANQIGFYIKPETFQSAGVVLAMAAAFVLTVAVRQALQVPAHESQKPSDQASAAIGKRRKALATRVALVVAMMAIVAGLTYWLQNGLNLKGTRTKSPAVVVAVEQKLRHEIQQRLNEAGWQPESLSVSVSPNLKQAECRLGRIWKNGLTQEPPWHAAIYLKPQGNGLWQVQGDGEFRSLRFSVDTTAEMEVVRDVRLSVATNTRLLAVSRQDDPPNPLAPQFPRLHDPETGEEVPALARELTAAKATRWLRPADSQWLEIPVLCLSNPQFDEDSLYYAALTAPSSAEFLAGGFALSHNLAGRHQFIKLRQPDSALQDVGCIVVALGGMGTNELSKLRAIGWRAKLEVAVGVGEWSDGSGVRLQPGDFTTVDMPHREGSLRISRVVPPYSTDKALRLHVFSTLKPGIQYRVVAKLKDGHSVRPSHVSIKTYPSQSIVAVVDYDVNPRELVEFQIQTRETEFVKLGTPDLSFLAETQAPDAATLLKRYAQEVWTRVLPQLEPLEVQEAPATATALASQIAAELLLPNKDVIDRYVLDQLPAGKPLDRSQWTTAYSLKKPFPPNLIHFWNPLVVALTFQQMAIQEKSSQDSAANWRALEEFAPVPQVVIDSDVDHPVISALYGNTLLAVWLERDTNGQYRCERVEWLRPKPQATQDYWPTPDRNSAAQKLIYDYSRTAWKQLLPHLETASPSEIAEAARNLAQSMIAPRTDLLRENARRQLAKLPVAKPIDRAQWRPRLAGRDGPDSLSELQEAMNLSLGFCPVRWDPVQIATRARLAAFLRLENPASLERRVIIPGLAATPLHTVANADPEHPEIVTRTGNELTIVRLQRDTIGRYELADFEWLAASTSSFSSPGSL